MHFIIWLLPPILLALSLRHWGPGMHLEYGTRVWRDRHERLPAPVADLLEQHRLPYFYGNLAADIINLKAYGGHYNHCHRWTIVDEMRAEAQSSAQEAFILGYLSHLAADTIAHNHYVPYHLARYVRARGFGHLYWELNADRFIKEERWELVSEMRAEEGLSEMDQLVHRAVPRKALSMGTNKLIFDRVLLISERQRWRKAMDRLHPIQKVELNADFLGRFQDAAVERIFMALDPEGLPHLLHLDTNGKAAQREAGGVRKRLIKATRPGSERDEAGAEHAAHFLEGMQSPPPDAHLDVNPHW